MNFKILQENFKRFIEEDSDELMRSLYEDQELVADVEECLYSLRKIKDRLEGTKYSLIPSVDKAIALLEEIEYDFNSRS